MTALGAGGERRGLPLELLVVWAVFFVVATEILVTYTRTPPEQLYHVTGEGFFAAAGRVLVFTNFPLALVALPLIPLLLDRLPGRLAEALAFVGFALSAVVFWPGVVDQADLDAKPVNALPALGVAIAAVMSIAVVLRGGVDHWQPRRLHDWLRVTLAVAIVPLAVPWFLADLGVSLNGVPVLGSIWQTGELRTQPGVAGLHPAVHHGHHHGMDGLLLVWTSLLVSRALPAVRGRILRRIAAGLLSVMLAYGIGEIANDFWLEQIVKRGWTNWEIPDVTVPSVSIGWLLILLGAGIIYRFWFGQEGRPDGGVALSSRPANPLTRT
jgi:hypothetical protein